MTHATQTERIRTRLESGGSLTSWQAIKWWGCTRLSGRIHELRHEHGLQIRDEWKTRNGKRYKSYFLA